MRFFISRRSPGLLPGAAALVGMLAASAATAQLNQNCIVSILNRNTPVNADGSWTLPNVPAGFGLVRARATCVNNGLTTSGQSDLFTLVANHMNAIPPIVLGNSTPIPTSLTLTAPSSSITQANGTLQLTTTATYSSGPSQNVTAASTGTAYLSSNTGIATVSIDGLVTAVTAGTAIIQGVNEGRQGIISIQVAPAGSSHQGIPDTWIQQYGLDANSPTLAVEDPDHDGLTNLQEFTAGTNPLVADTDGDGISDGDEVNGTGLACTTVAPIQCYHTSPLLADTDGDGVQDLTEIQHGSDPTNAASLNLATELTGITVTPPSFTMIVNSLNQTASVQLTVTGNLVDGRTMDLTSTARGTNYSSDRLDICSFGSPDGRVFAGNVGGCTITVMSNGFTRLVTGSVAGFTPASVSFLAIPGEAEAVAVSGDFAYVAAGSAGLQVVSLSSDRTTPAIAGNLSLPNGASAYDVNLVGTTAYVASSAGLHVIDITDPTMPSLRGSFSASSSLSVIARGTTAYLGSGANLVLVNISNPNAMIQISSTSMGGTVYGLAVDSQRNLVAAAAGSSGLKLVDVTNPALPVVKGTAVTGDARAVALNGNLAFVADYTTSTNSVDITSLTAPAVLSHITDPNVGGFLQGIVLANNFALAADVKFVNGIPITDISTPSNLQARDILNFPQRDDNGMGIAIDSAFVYVATQHNSLTRTDPEGDSRLYIGQYLPRQDLAGVPPTISLTSPPNGSTQYQGQQLTVVADASDDVAVASVEFDVTGQLPFITTSAPYQYTFTVPAGATSLTLGGRATDLGGNIGTAANITVNVIPDPLTLVTGLVTDAATPPNPVANATVTAPGGLTAITGVDGRFSIPGVPTVLGNIVVTATATINTNSLTGSSLSFPPNRGGVTDVGTIALIPATFITTYGTNISRCDDCSFTENFGFAFPFYGVNQTSGFVGTNGYITFGGGDSTYSETLNAFNDIPRISAFFDDLYAACASPEAGLYVNNTLPNVFVVTYLNTPHYSACTGPNTIQMQLYPDGRIIFAYSGITSINTGTIVGLTPGPNSPAQAADYDQQPNFDAPAGSAIYEYFNDTNLFDLDGGFIIFTPNAGGGYNVRTLPRPAAPAGQITGQSLGAGTGNQTGSGGTGPGTVSLANAEIIVHSSGNVHWVGMTDTDANGHFTLNNVPAGGISVQVIRNGKVIGQGGGLFAGGSLTPSQVLTIILTPPVPGGKTRPQP
ncbi:MAG TPA: Ig-like domain-containing protein [Bryobacteraceae bacterium]|jgi:hypothetical protein|nr:Ig-like domain-containing protein [Bryobacteraceae bacterium]